MRSKCSSPNIAVLFCTRTSRSMYRHRRRAHLSSTVAAHSAPKRTLVPFDEPLHEFGLVPRDWVRPIRPHGNQFDLECLLFVDPKGRWFGCVGGTFSQACVSADVCASHRPDSVGRVALSVAADAKLSEVIVPLGSGK